jgi:hypothetical protein
MTSRMSAKFVFLTVEKKYGSLRSFLCAFDSRNIQTTELLNNYIHIEKNKLI